MTPSKAAKKAEPTTYVVLERFTAQGEGDKPAWIAVDRVAAHGQEKPIIEKWAGEKKRTGIFKLCPARSWKGGVKVFEQTRMASEPIGEG
jgi:hypothetical protein